ncbi:MAG TPA: gliding motility protein GldM [Cyclobacteriaceae bacterium]|nr:gliding motility protein GldM [Cyclobacteriaceae bacterium]
MAGGKETPRQKMIGMMYLVLTALLALQVSNAVLEKFALINDALETLSAQTNEKNQATLDAIQKAVTPDAKDSIKTAYAKAQEVRALTSKTIADLSKLKKEFLVISDAAGIDEKFINDHSSKVAYAMMDPRQTKGKDYEKLLNNYAVELSKLTMGGPTFDKLAKPPAEMKEFKNDKKNARKDFIEFTFENTPPIAAYASVTEMESQIYAYESQALQRLNDIAGNLTLKFDKVLPMIIPDANSVIAGSKYTAKMYIGASNSAINPSMFIDGKSLPIEKDAAGVSFGKVEFVAGGGGYKNGVAEKSYTARINVKGTDYTIPVNYKVIAPTVKITSGALSKLYINCGNEMNVEIPGLGTNFVPGYSAGTEAEVIKSDKVGQITVIPKSKAKVKLAVSNSGTPIETVTFDVRTAPAPQVLVEAAGREMNSKDGVPRAQLGQLKIRAKADEDFASTVPKDAEFRIRKGRVYLRKGTALGTPIEFSGEALNLGAFMQTAKPGDVLSFELESITRRTFKGENEPVVLTTAIKYISIPIAN